MTHSDLQAEIERQRVAKEIHYADTVRLERENRKLRDFNLRFALSLSLINALFVVLVVLMPWW